MSKLKYYTINCKPSSQPLKFPTFQKVRKFFSNATNSNVFSILVSGQKSTTITSCYKELRQLYTKCSVQTQIRNKNVLTACNTEMILMKERKHHSAYEKKKIFESENPVPALDSKR